MYGKYWLRIDNSTPSVKVAESNSRMKRQSHMCYGRVDTPELESRVLAKNRWCDLSDRHQPYVLISW